MFTWGVTDVWTWIPSRDRRLVGQQMQVIRLNVGDLPEHFYE